KKKKGNAEAFPFSDLMRTTRFDLEPFFMTTQTNVAIEINKPPPPIFVLCINTSFSILRSNSYFVKTKHT
ncbi:hypothetical protein, partial [Enterococcus avium]